MSRRRTRTAVHVDAIMLEATTLVAIIEPALMGLDTGKAGHPTHTPGANPNSTPSTGPDAITGSTTERAALTPDRADLDEQALYKAIRAAHTQLRLATILARRWANPTTIDVPTRIAAIDQDLWCDNCGRWGFHNVRRPNGKHCEFCAGFNSTWKQLPPRDVLELQAAKGRIYVNDIRRILARQKQQTKKGAA